MGFQVFEVAELTIDVQERCRHLLQNSLIDLGLPKSAVDDLVLAVGELLSNVTRYQEKKTVACEAKIPTCSVGPNIVLVVLTGINYCEPPQQIPNFNLGEDKERYGGYGLFLVKQLVDAYKPLPKGKGLYLIKSWDSAGPDCKSGRVFYFSKINFCF